MKAEIAPNGYLHVEPVSPTEVYALRHWRKGNPSVRIIALEGGFIDDIHSVDTDTFNKPEKKDPVEDLPKPAENLHLKARVAPSPLRVEDLSKPAETVSSPLDRTSIKMELSALGVDYNPKTRTENLARLLQKIKARNTSSPAETPLIQEEEKAPVAPVAVTSPAPVAEEKAVEVIAPLERVDLKTVISHLQKYAAKFGTEKAFAKLVDLKVNMVSELSEQQRSQLYADIKKELEDG